MAYLNWDIPTHRETILKRELPLTKFWCFDEIHKYTSWRDYLKGVYDEFHNDHRIMVTGSARLDMLRKSGDSLQAQIFVECKWGDSSTSAHLHYLQKKFPNAKFYQISATGKKQFINKKNIVHMPAVNFLQQLI